MLALRVKVTLAIISVVSRQGSCNQERETCTSGERAPEAKV